MAARTYHFPSPRPPLGTAFLLQLGLACLALAIGALVYLSERDPARVYFLHGWAPSWSGMADFGSLEGQLPDALHVFAFSLLTAAVLAGRRTAAFLGCASWWAIDSAFELAQHSAWAPWLAAHAPRFEGIPVLENTAAYFAFGTFDPADLLAIAVGAAAAWLTLRWIERFAPSGGCAPFVKQRGGRS